MKTKILSVVLVLIPSIVTAAGIKLEWDYADNVYNPAVGFSVYRDVDCIGDFLFLASTTRTTQIYTDTNVQPGKRYCYQVTATGIEGDESSASNTVAFQVPLPPANAPSNLRGVYVQ